MTGGLDAPWYVALPLSLFWGAMGLCFILLMIIILSWVIFERKNMTFDQWTTIVFTRLKEFIFG